MQISQNGIDLIKSFEGLELTAYPDPASGGEPWTIGYGSTANVAPGMTITLQEADTMLLAVLQSTVTAVNDVIDTTVSQNQFDAMVSFTYNLGAGNLRQSSMLRLTNDGNFSAAADAFLLWDQASGSFNQGIYNRRQKERALYLTPDGIEPIAVS